MTRTQHHGGRLYHDVVFDFDNNHDHDDHDNDNRRHYYYSVVARTYALATYPLGNW